MVSQSTNIVLLFPRHYVGGYVPNSVYSTRTQYRTQMYPTLSNQGTPPPPSPGGQASSVGGSSNGNNSDYENAYTGPSNRKSRFDTRTERENLRNENVHNLYNVSSTQTARYDSCDELKSPNSEEYDSYGSDLEGRAQWGSGYHDNRGYRGRVPADSADYTRYGSLERNTKMAADHSLVLTDLSPSKFGSKRESHTDPRDSPYQIVDMPPVRRMEYYPDYGANPPAPTGHSEYATHNSSIHYMDSSQSSAGSSVTSSQQGAWYEGSVRQQAPPSTPQFESPPAMYVQQELQNPPVAGSGAGGDPGGYSYPTPSTNSTQPPGTGDSMTVTKYKSYVEVSKPFEMSDFYKYSERLRKQRHVDTSPQPGSPQPYSGGLQTPTSEDGSVRSNSRPASPFTQPPPPSHTHHQPANQPSSPYHTASGPFGPGNGTVHSNYQQYNSQSTVQHLPYRAPQAMNCEPVSDPTLQASQRIV